VAWKLRFAKPAQLIRRAKWNSLKLVIATTEDDFRFVTKEFVKPTAEGSRQFMNGKSHHPYATLKSILFGEAIRLKQLNQREEDYLTSLNLKENQSAQTFLVQT